MNYNPLISVIIPNYNHSEYLDKRIQSVLGQSYENIEVILLDDFSSDNSREVIKSYETNEKVSHIVFNKVNSKSTFIQWKKGVDLSKGDIIWIAESDDISSIDFLMTLVPVFEDEKIGCCFCGSNFIDNNNLIIQKSDDCSNDYYISINNMFEKGFHRGNLIRNASAAIIRKKAIKAFPSESLNLKFIGDWIFWLNILKNNYSIKYKSDFLNFFRIHEGNVSTKAVKDNLIVSEGVSLFKYLKKNFNLSSDQLKILNDYWYGRFLFMYFPFRPLSNYNLSKFKGLLKLIFYEPKIFWALFVKRIRLF